MYRSFISAIAGLALAVSGMVATPAHADNHDLMRGLAGLAALAIIGKVISDQRDDRHQQAPVTRHATPQYHQKQTLRPQYHQQQTHRPQYQQPQYHQPQPRHLPDRVARRDLPASCFHAFDTRQGTVRMFGQRCLEQNYRHAARLPQNCSIAVKTGRGLRYGYQARCLREHGYRMARG